MKKFKRSIRTSISTQFAWIFIGLMAGTVLLCLFINTAFLGKYYIRTKTNIIFDAYESIGKAAASDSYGTREFQSRIDEICLENNITVYIMDVNSRSVFVSGNGGQELELRLMGYIFGMPMDDIMVLEKGEDYWLQRTGKEGDEYLEMYGRLATGISFIMSTPLESIRQSAALANRFFVYVGCVGAVLGGLVIWFVTRRIARPIQKLNDISERMVHLDFDVKYQGGSQNEIGMLGENMNKLSNSLEKAISELKTANNELQKDIEKKEQIDEMRKEFLSSVSHELKTPIALIQGYAEGLQEGINDDQESREFYCEVIVDEASKMNNIVKKLLSLNQLEFGNDVVTMERFDVVALLSNCIQSSAILTKQNGITVQMQEIGPVYVWAEEFKVEEVFMNYFTNAINHCQGEKIIEVKLEQGEGKVKVSVFNTGAPIPEDSIDHIWEKFYKVDKARTREYGGSGVGLSIVKAIMEALHQEYGVENRDDGVLFWFELETVQE